MYLSSALDGPVGIAAAAHVAQALPGATWRTGSRPRCCSRTRSPRASAPWRAGTSTCTGGPGLGVEIDEDALARHRIDLG